MIEEEMKVPYSFAPAQASRQRASAVAALGAVYLAEERPRRQPSTSRIICGNRRRSASARSQSARARWISWQPVLWSWRRNNGGRNGNAKRASCSDSGFSAGDLPAVRALELECFSDAWSEKLLQDLLTSSWDKTWVLKEDETVRGYSNFRVIAGEGELMRIAVHGACRGAAMGGF